MVLPHRVHGSREIWNPFWMSIFYQANIRQALVNMVINLQVLHKVGHLHIKWELNTFSRSLLRWIWELMRLPNSCCPACFIPLQLIIVIILGKEYKLWGPSLCSFLQIPIISHLFHPNIFLSTLFSNTISLYRISGFHGGDYEECRLMGYKNPDHSSHETHYISTTEPSQLMLCKIWGLHGGDYEECRLLGYKNPVRTSQETHLRYRAQTLMLCKIWGFHGGDYEECRLLGCYAVSL
jgi:hypothetical protein